MSRAALGGARAAYASSTARFWRKAISSKPSKIATRVVACPKNKKNTTTVVGGCWTCGRAKKKYSLRDSNPRPKTSALNWRLRPLGQNCDSIGRALVVEADPTILDRPRTTNPKFVILGSVWAATFCYFLISRRIVTRIPPCAFRSRSIRLEPYDAWRFWSLTRVFTGTAPSSAPTATRLCGRVPPAGRACRR